MYGVNIIKKVVHSSGVCGCDVTRTLGDCLDCKVGQDVNGEDGKGASEESTRTEYDGGMSSEDNEEPEPCCWRTVSTNGIAQILLELRLPEDLHMMNEVTSVYLESRNEELLDRPQLMYIETTGKQDKRWYLLCKRTICYDAQPTPNNASQILARDEDDRSVLLTNIHSHRLRTYVRITLNYKTEHEYHGKIYNMVIDRINIINRINFGSHMYNWIELTQKVYKAPSWPVTRLGPSLSSSPTAENKRLDSVPKMEQEKRISVTKEETQSLTIEVEEVSESVSEKSIEEAAEESPIKESVADTSKTEDVEEAVFEHQKLSVSITLDQPTNDEGHSQEEEAAQLVQDDFVLSTSETFSDINTSSLVNPKKYIGAASEAYEMTISETPQVEKINITQSVQSVPMPLQSVNTEELIPVSFLKREDKQLIASYVSSEMEGKKGKAKVSLSLVVPEEVKRALRCNEEPSSRDMGQVVLNIYRKGCNSNVTRLNLASINDLRLMGKKLYVNKDICITKGDTKTIYNMLHALLLLNECIQA